VIFVGYGIRKNYSMVTFQAKYRIDQIVFYNFSDGRVREGKKFVTITCIINSVEFSKNGVSYVVDQMDRGGVMGINWLVGEYELWVSKECCYISNKRLINEKDKS